MIDIWVDPCSARDGTNVPARCRDHVLNNQGIHPGLFRGDQQIGSPLQLIAEHQDIEGEETANCRLEPIHQLGRSSIRKFSAR